MFKLDHIMIETTKPLEMADMVSESLGLPLAWPLIEKDDYSSVGVNVGTVNFEFIDFKTRFGIPGKSFSGMSGLAFKIEDSEENAIRTLTRLGLEHRIGEKIDTHTTITVEENNIFPTLFLVKYHFDTTGWQTRLKKEFQVCQGGRFQIERFRSFVIGQPLAAEITNDFDVIGSDNRSTCSQIIFETSRNSAQPVVIPDLIENLEIVLT